MISIDAAETWLSETYLADSPSPVLKSEGFVVAREIQQPASLGDRSQKPSWKDHSTQPDNNMATEPTACDDIFVVKAYLSLTKTIPDPRPATDVSISFDEIHNICHEDEYGRSLYDDLCSVMSDLKANSFAAIFISTSSSFSHLATAVTVHCSPRGRNPVNIRHSAPLCELPFDAFHISHGYVKEKTLYRNTILDFKIILSFGRPLSVS